MDHKELRDAELSLTGTPCPFEKAIATRTCGCQHAAKIQIAEREAMRCTAADDAQYLCVQLLMLLVENGTFALRQAATPAALPHAKALKIQCGGLLGLQRALDAHETSPRVNNIFALVKRALLRYKDLASLPFAEIVREVSSYSARKPKSTVSRSRPEGS